MRKLTRNEIAGHVLEIARRVSGYPDATIDKFVSRDLGINGWDAIDLFEEIEQYYSVDLRLLVDNGEKKPRAPVSFFSKSTFEARDLSLEEIIDFVVANI